MTRSAPLRTIIRPEDFHGSLCTSARSNCRAFQIAKHVKELVQIPVYGKCSSANLRHTVGLTNIALSTSSAITETGIPNP